MKAKLMFFILLFELCYLFSISQDKTLPQGKSSIYLNVGKPIRDVQIWKIDSQNIEYVRNGNLADVKISNVAKIVFYNGSVKVFNSQINNETNNNDEIIKLDTCILFRRFHISIGVGRNIRSAKSLFSNTFYSSEYRGLILKNYSIPTIIGGASQVYFTERFLLEFEYSVNEKLRFGLGYFPFSAGFIGYKGNYDLAYHCITERIEGDRFNFSSSYYLAKCKKSCGFNFSIGASVFYNYASLSKQVTVFDTSNYNPLLIVYQL